MSTAVAAVSTHASFSRSILMAVIYYGSLGVIMLGVQPAVELHLAKELGLSPSMIGTLFFMELIAMGLATLPSYLWLGRIDGRLVAFCACALFVVGNLLSGLMLHDYSLLLVARAVTGLGGGTMMILSMTMGATSSEPDRTYAWLVIGQVVSGAAVLYFMPTLLSLGQGLPTLFFLLAALGLAALPLAHQFSMTQSAQMTVAARPSPPVREELGKILLVIAAAAAFNAAMGALWAFAGEWAVAAGLSAARTAFVLSMSSIFGIAGSVLALLLGDHVSRARVLLFGYGAIVLGLLAMHFALGEGSYVGGAVLQAFGWNFSVPYIFSAIAACDRSGRLVSSISLAFGVGLAMGPLGAGALMERGGIDLLAACCGVTLIVAAGLIQWIAHLPRAR